MSDPALDTGLQAAPLAGPAGTRAAAPGPIRRQLNLVRELAITSFRLKYSGSALGYAWSLLKPLLQFATLYFVFSQLLKVGAGSPHLALQILVGIVLWTFFAETTSSAMHSMVGNATMLKKAYFPRISLVIAASLTSLMTFLINMALVIVIAAPLGQVELGARTLALAPLLLELYVLTLGAGLLLSCLYVFFRDVSHIWEVVLQVLFYASAVVFPLAVAGEYTKLVALNPVAQVVEDARHAMVSPALPWTAAFTGALYLVPISITVVAGVLGILVFRRMSPKIPENL